MSQGAGRIQFPEPTSYKLSFDLHTHVLAPLNKAQEISKCLSKEDNSSVASNKKMGDRVSKYHTA